MNEVLADRDRLWCRALAATLGLDEIARVTAEFNRIRPDKAVEHGAHPTLLCTCETIDTQVTKLLNSKCPVHNPQSG